jgi:hypothetical protein
MAKSPIQKSLLAGVLLTACGESTSAADTAGVNDSEESASTSDSDSADTQGSATSASSTGEGSLQPCSTESPYWSQECGEALKQHCRSIPDEQRCGEVEPLIFDEFYVV